MPGVLTQAIGCSLKLPHAVVVGIIHAAVYASERPSKVFTEIIRIPLDPLGQITVHRASVETHCLHETLGLYKGNRLLARFRAGRNSHRLRARARSRTRRNRNVLRNSDSLHS